MYALPSAFAICEGIRVYCGKYLSRPCFGTGYFRKGVYMFQPVNSKTDFAKQEEEILEFWRRESVFKEYRRAQRLPAFRAFEDLPLPTESGIHHVLSRVFKDVIPRYKTMKGYMRAHSRLGYAWFTGRTWS